MAKEYNNRRSPRSRNSVPRQFLAIAVTFILGYLAASFFDVEIISQWVNAQVLAHHEMKKEPTKPQAQAAIPPKPKFEFYTLLTNEKTSSAQPSANAAAQAAAVANNTTHVNSNVPASVTSAAAQTLGSASNPASAAVKTTTNEVVASTAIVPEGTIKPSVPQPKSQQPNLATKPDTAAERGTYLVQVASFKGRQDAENMKGTLILKGFNAYIIPVSHPTKGNWFRVVVGPYPSRVFAQQAQLSLAKNQHLNGMITSG